MYFLLTLFLLTLPVVPHTEEDIDLLADVMWLENGHTGDTEEENRECLILTGAVVLNRVKSGEWGGDTVREVVYAKGQYADVTKSRIGKCDTPEWVRDLAKSILTFGTNVPDYVIYQSMQSNLGTRWKVIDGEYFATNGGHKDEGFDLCAEVFSLDNYVFRDLLDDLRSTIRGFHRTVKRYIRRYRNSVSDRRLDVAYKS